MNIKKIALVILLFFNLPTFIFSQTFEVNYKTSYDDTSYEALELNNGNFVIVINKGDFFTEFADFMLLIINQNGNIIDSVNYIGSKEYNYFGIENFYHINDSVFVGMRICIDSQANYFLNFLKFNNDYNVLLDTIVGLEIPELFLIYKTLTSDNRVLITATETVNNEVFLYDYDLYSDTLQYHSIIDTGGSVVQIPMVSYNLPDKNVYHLYLFDAYRTIYEISKTDFSVDTTFNYYPYNFQPRKAISSFNDSTYFVAGRESDLSNPDVRFIPSYFEISQNGNILDYHIYDMQNDTSSFFVPDCFAKTDNRLYFAMTYNYTSEPPFTIIPEQRWIWLMCLYPDGTLDWQRFYKGEVNYMPYKLLPTSDGGLLIVSNKYDWNDPVPYQRDAYILKVDSTGWYQGLTTGLLEQTKENQILVYPNPASDYVHFAFGYYSNLQIAIYSSQGKQVFNGQFAKKATIDISLLPAGMYTYTINDNGGFFERGKIIKQ